MLPLHPGKRCNHSEMIASSDIEDTDTSSLNTNRGFMKTIGQLHGFDYLSWVVQLPPWLVICKRIMVKVMLEQQSDSPFGLPQVTSVSPAGLVPAKRALLSLNLARKVRSLTNDGTRNRKIIFRGEVELSPLFSAVGPLSHLVILSRSARSISRPVAKAAANKAKLPAHLMCVNLCIIGRFQCLSRSII